MPKCTDGTMDLGRLGRRVIEANFEGGDIGSDGGVLLLRRVDERIGLSRAAAAVLSDPRDPTRITHSLRDLLAQRIYGLCCGYEDLNDHDVLRYDLLMQTAVGRVDALASSPTLSRLETRATRAQAVALHGVLIEQFIASHKTRTGELVLDIDASDVPLHGSQELCRVPRLLRPPLLPAAVRVLRPGDARVRAAAQPHRRRQERRGGDQAAGAAAAPGVARRADHRARRLGLLSPALAALVRALGRELHRRAGAQRAAGSARCTTPRRCSPTSTSAPAPSSA